MKKTNKKDIENMCLNRHDISFINQIKNGVFYCMQRNSMVSFTNDCQKCKYYKGGLYGEK